ncbi:YbjN domain-containing protein [Corynebacterium pseudodiphtheriticum]|uniref:YbjN domain-containing protein n=1 Tax=Corynebacterium pseudodiphtheriticum TaxID=37637 RepID=UPI0020BDFC90|nr:YbjN domain-containing protein [Corynebacterium pseudodiphtheriticum]UQV53300.1 YbjN domain-containing protein [Corynebacterium pseudodiphtheriticum]
MNQATQLAPASIDRVITTMREFNVELTKVQDKEIATANLNDTLCTFAVLGSAMVVRSEVATDTKYDNADAGLFLAANQINSTSIGARAVIAEHEGKLIVRTERDIVVAAGISDEQLKTTLKTAVDGVVRAQDAMVAAAEEMRKLNEHRDQ